MEQQAGVIVRLTRDSGHQDQFTLLLVDWSDKLTRAIAVPFTIIAPITTTGSTMLSVASAGLWSIVVDLAYAVLIFPLLFTSEVHQKSPPLTKVTFIPSLVGVIFVYMFVSLLGSQNRDELQIVRLATIKSWPNSKFVREVVEDLLAESD